MNNIYDFLKKGDKVSIPTKGMINLPETITREVKEGQMICETCLGLGLHQYEERGHKYIGSCKNCHGGVAEICEHCGKQKIGRIGYTSFHDCDEGKKAFDEYQKKKEEESLEKARKHFEESRKIPLSEYELDYVFINDDFVSVDELDDKFEGMKNDEIPYIVAAEKFIPKLDASDIAQRIYEEAPEDYELDEISLQKILDEWILKQNHHWYVPDDSTYVILKK